jgi:DNA-binding protein HU-beta
MTGAIWHIYLVECADGSLYTGIATDVERRFREHFFGKGARYTRSRKAIRLVASRPIGSRSDALRAEIAIKRLPREKKIEAVGSLTFVSIHQERHVTMNKSELIEIAAKEADITKASAEKVLAAIIGAITKAVSKGDSVALIGFGSFKASKRAARTGVNPKTGEKLKIAATTVPRFTAGAGFKAAVAGKKAAKKK